MEVGRRRAGCIAFRVLWVRVAVRAARRLAPAPASCIARTVWRSLPLPAAVRRSAGSAFVHVACPQVGVAVGGLTPARKEQADVAGRA